MNNNIWFCKTCGHMNNSSANTCILCKQMKRTSLFPKTRIIQKSDPSIMLDRVNQNEIDFKELQTRLKTAKKKLEEEQNSLPPTGAIKLIVPNNWTGVIMTVIVVAAIVTLIVLVKLFFK